MNENPTAQPAVPAYIGAIRSLPTVEGIERLLAAMDEQARLDREADEALVEVPDLSVEDGMLVDYTTGTLATDGSLDYDTYPVADALSNEVLRGRLAKLTAAAIRVEVARSRTFGDYVAALDELQCTALLYGEDPDLA